MRQSLTAIERVWHEALRSVLGCLGAKTGVPATRLPFLLEETSCSRLKPSRCYIISGISGSGKTTLGRELEARGYRKIPNVVTRPPRPGETEHDYVFLGGKDFHEWRERGRFAFARRTNGVWHGFLREHLSLLQDSRSRVWLDKSVPSALELVRYLAPGSFSAVYVLPPAFSELYRRIAGRENDRRDAAIAALSDAEIAERFLEETKELEASPALPYCYLVNDDIKRIVALLAPGI